MQFCRVLPCFLENGKENHQETRLCYPHRIPLKHSNRKNAQKKRNYSQRNKQGIPKEQGKEGHGRELRNSSEIRVKLEGARWKGAFCALPRCPNWSRNRTGENRTGKPRPLESTLFADASVDTFVGRFAGDLFWGDFKGLRTRAHSWVKVRFRLLCAPPTNRKLESHRASDIATQIASKSVETKAGVDSEIAVA